MLCLVNVARLKMWPPAAGAVGGIFIEHKTRNKTACFVWIVFIAVRVVLDTVARLPFMETHGRGIKNKPSRGITKIL